MFCTHTLTLSLHSKAMERSPPSPLTNTDHVVYLSSLSCQDTYPENNPSAFTNNIIPIHLDPTLKYEASMHGTYIPKSTCTLSKDDPDFEIVLCFSHSINSSSNHQNQLLDTVKFRPTNNTLSTDPREVVRTLNKQLQTFLIGLYPHDYISYYFDPLNGVFGYDNIQNRIYVNTKVSLNRLKNYPISLTLLFKEGIAGVLGFIAGENVDVFRLKEADNPPVTIQYAPFQPTTTSNDSSSAVAYNLIKDDPQFEIWFYRTTPPSIYTNTQIIYKPLKNTSTHQLSQLIEILNDEITKYLSLFPSESIENCFDIDKGIFGYDDKKKRVYVNTRTAQHPETLSIKLKSGIAKLLGFSADTPIDVCRFQELDIENPDNYPRMIMTRATYPPRMHADVDYLHIYCDIVNPSRFGSQSVNILAMSPFNSVNYYSVLSPLYKKIDRACIESISILITDQYGRRIYFPRDRSVTIVLHIRPISST